MTRSGILAAVGLFSLLTSTAYSKHIAYDGKITIGSGTATSISLAGTGSGCAGVLFETEDSVGCLPGITSLSFAPGYTAGTSSYTEVVGDGSHYTAFLWPPSSASAFNSSNNGPYAQTDVVAAVISGAGTGACAASTNANCWSLEFDYDSVSKAGGMLPVVTPLTSCPGGGAASVSVAAGGVTSTYTSSNPCAINGTEMEFIGTKLTGTFCSDGAPCGTPTSGTPTAAPEINSSSAISALTLLAGCLAVLFGGSRSFRQRATV
jgi:hypothetical protein